MQLNVKHVLALFQVYATYIALFAAPLAYYSHLKNLTLWSHIIALNSTE
jgi:hypothetical protein